MTSLSSASSVPTVTSLCCKKNLKIFDQQASFPTRSPASSSGSTPTRSSASSSESTPARSPLSSRDLFSHHSPEELSLRMDCFDEKQIKKTKTAIEIDSVSKKIPDDLFFQMVLPYLPLENRIGFIQAFGKKHLNYQWKLKSKPTLPFVLPDAKKDVFASKAGFKANTLFSSLKEIFRYPEQTVENSDSKIQAKYILILKHIIFNFVEAFYDIYVENKFPFSHFHLSNVFEWLGQKNLFDKIKTALKKVDFKLFSYAHIYRARSQFEVFIAA